MAGTFSAAYRLPGATAATAVRARKSRRETIREFDANESSERLYLVSTLLSNF